MIARPMPRVLSEYAGIVVMSLLFTVLFLGGWHGPFSDSLGPVWTLFNALTGLYRIDQGEIRLGDARLDTAKPHQVLQHGLARTFQNIRLFAHMTALENVMVGRHARTHSGVLGAVLRTHATRAEEAATRDHARALLQRVGIAAHAERLAKQLSYGDQRRLEIARALASEPKI